MAVALLLSFALGPAVLLLRRWHVNRVLAVIAVVMLAFAVIADIGALIGGQLANLAEILPGHQANLTEKIHSLQDTATQQWHCRTCRGDTERSRQTRSPSPVTGQAARKRPHLPVQQQKPVPVRDPPVASDPRPADPAGRRAAASAAGDGWHHRRLPLRLGSCFGDQTPSTVKR
jgi:AI-2E family transporter